MAWTKCLSEDQYVNGFNRACIIEDVSSMPVTAKSLVAQAEEWVRIVRQQAFHLGLIALFDKHPTLESFDLHPEASARGVTLKSFAMPIVNVSDKISKSRTERAIQNDLSALRGNTGNNSREVINDILREVVNVANLSLNRGNVQDYLRQVLGEELYALRHRQIETKLLRQTVDDVAIDHRPLVATRQRL